MKTITALVAAGLMLTMAPGATAETNYYEQNRAFLTEMVLNHWGITELDAQSIEAINQYAGLRADVNLATLDHLATPIGNADVGEIWWNGFGNIGAALPASPFCASIPFHWAYYQWVATPNQLSMPAGYYSTWTMNHAGLGPLSFYASSGTITGIACYFNSPFFSYAYANGVLTHS